MSDQKSPALSAQGSAQGSSQKMVTELKVSGHLMALDTGLFCIFTAPGSPVPDPATGLPGVRVSLPSGPAFRPEVVTISTFREDGWLGGNDGAALVRVLRGPAQLLVTIYQAPNSTGEAPRLQILRLNDGTPNLQAAPAAAQARPQPAQQRQAPAQVAAAQPALAAPKQAAPSAAPQNTPPGGQAPDTDAASQAEIVAHVQGRSDVLTRLGEWMGEPGSKRWIEGFAIAPKSQIGANDIEYQAVLGRGWLSPWAEGGQYCGSRGMSLPILGLRVRLRGEAADRFDCVVSASFTDGTKVGPLDNGEPAQSESLAPLEAFQIRIVKRGETAEQPEAAAPKPKATKTPVAKPPAAKKVPVAPAKPPVPAKPAGKGSTRGKR